MVAGNREAIHIAAAREWIPRVRERRDRSDQHCESEYRQSHQRNLFEPNPRLYRPKRD